MYIYILLSIVLGIFIAYFYGLSLLYQKGRAPSIYQGIFSALRVIITGFMLYYLLRSGTINFILFFISFILTLFTMLIRYSNYTE